MGKRIRKRSSASTEYMHDSDEFKVPYEASKQRYASDRLILEGNHSSSHALRFSCYAVSTANFSSVVCGNRKASCKFLIAPYIIERLRVCYCQKYYL